MRIWTSRCAVAAALVALSIGCGRRDATATSEPRDFTRQTTCSLDGMVLADYPGPKGQIHYAGAGEPEYFCDLVELFRMYLAPEQARTVRGIYVQDMGKAAWEEPRGFWTDARAAFFVLGSRKHGSMGPTIASFALEPDARRFAAEHGGRVLRFADVKPQDAVLDGGALHDGPM